MIISFDFICDEAPLFSKVAAIFKDKGDTVAGLTLGKRWKSYWEGKYKTSETDLDFQENIDISSEMDRLEKDYPNCNISSFLQSDRFLSKLSRRQQYISLIQTFKKVEKYFSDYKPEIHFSTGIAYLYNLVVLAVCNKYKIVHISLYATRDKTPRFTASLSDGGTWELVEKKFQDIISTNVNCTEISLSRARNSLEQFRNSEHNPHYMEFARQSYGLKKIFIQEFVTRIKYWYVDGWGRCHGDYITQHPAWYAWRDFKKILRAQLLKTVKKYIFDEIRPGKGEYYLFPIHLQPEASTLILSPWNINQLETIKNISKCLPANACLYVKEHKSSFGRNSLWFYKQIKNIYNVRLIAPWEDVPSLIQNSRGVIVLSGTMGWEALKYGVPVYLLGNVFYKNIKGVIKISSYNELINKLREEKKNGHEDAIEKELLSFMTALQEESYKGIFDVAKMDTREMVLSKENINDVYTGLVKIISKVKNAS